MGNTPDILEEIGSDSQNVVVAAGDPDKLLQWIVRLEIRDAECQFRYVDKNGNVNSRLSSSIRLSKEDAMQFAKAITNGHTKYKAKAMLYATAKPKR